MSYQATTFTNCFPLDSSTLVDNASTKNLINEYKSEIEYIPYSQFVDYIVADEAETMLDNINAFDKLFKAAVNDAVSKKIAQPTPKAASVSQTGLTKEQFKTMSIAQQTELFMTNRDLYMELSK